MIAREGHHNTTGHDDCLGTVAQPASGSRDPSYGFGRSLWRSTAGPRKRRRTAKDTPTKKRAAEAAALLLVVGQRRAVLKSTYGGIYPSHTSAQEARRLKWASEKKKDRQYSGATQTRRQSEQNVLAEASSIDSTHSRRPKTTSNCSQQRHHGITNKRKGTRTHLAHSLELLKALRHSGHRRAPLVSFKIFQSRACCESSIDIFG